jgi:hypothetical protein
MLHLHRATRRRQASPGVQLASLAVSAAALLALLFASSRCDPHDVLRLAELVVR